MPLSGLKILDFTTLLPGPLATMNLADLGADVLRIESLSKPDLVRFIPPFIDEKGDISCVHAYLNRNKRSLGLDLKNKESVSIIEKLILEKGFDIIIEQFRPGVMDRFGLSYQRFKEIKPDIIYCSITGYGQTGPLKNRAGHDINYLSLSGVMSFSGTKKSGPFVPGIQIADIAGSHNCVTGILAAVIHRMNTGMGQHIDIAMTDCMFQYNALTGPKTLCGGEDAGYETEVLNGGSLYGCYETLDERYLSFGGLEPQFSTSFFEALGLDDLIEGGVFQFGNIEKAKNAVKNVIKSKPLSYWVEKFAEIDACVEPVLTFSEAVLTDQAKARNLVVEVPFSEAKTIPQIACPIKFSECGASYKWVGCRLGNDNDLILSSLGFSESEISKIKGNGVLG
ncbi:CaiB/BaiF CoA transferase family protein [Desulforegula conservatrix]|uniref:CaiB/BaiF CoA transferase family protein n=1 Tax=Desulforegula conservatrix TaxID=153026 RepID=UPI000422DB4F|nr:CaiB/BaiF CoA-transferase family protein [Desulforegula conservatrix]